jgi:hypothetical protein
VDHPRGDTVFANLSQSIRSQNVAPLDLIDFKAEFAARPLAEPEAESWAISLHERGRNDARNGHNQNADFAIPMFAASGRSEPDF